jgi:calcineurin-like phosphoesterase
MFGIKKKQCYIEKENRLLRPKNLFEPSPGKGFEIFKIQKIKN